MITLDDFNRLIARIRTKLALMVGRAVLAAVDNSGKTQKVQVVALYDETITGVERFQEYGLETRPKKDAEVLLVFIGGNREQGVAACVHDRRYRPKDLAEGEVALYTSEDGAGKEHRVHLKSGKGIDIVGADVQIKVTGNALIGAASGHKAACLETLVTAINNIITALNSHKHSAVQAGGGVSGPPVDSITSLTPADHLTEEVKLT